MKWDLYDHIILFPLYDAHDGPRGQENHFWYKLARGKSSNYPATISNPDVVKWCKPAPLKPHQSDSSWYAERSKSRYILHMWSICNVDLAG